MLVPSAINMETHRHRTQIDEATIERRCVPIVIDTLMPRASKLRMDFSAIQEIYVRSWKRVFVIMGYNAITLYDRKPYSTRRIRSIPLLTLSMISDPSILLGSHHMIYLTIPLSVNPNQIEISCYGELPKFMHCDDTNFAVDQAHFIAGPTW